MSCHRAIGRVLLLVGLAGGITLATGCMNMLAGGPAQSGPFFTPTNHAGESTLPAGIRRVVLLPLAGGNVLPSTSAADLDPVVAAALQRQNRFEVVVVSREVCRRLFTVEELSSVELLPANFMAVLRREYAADAVILVDVTVFRAYRPLAIGFRAKLATVQDVRLVWTFDNLFSAADAAVANSARRNYLKGAPRDIPADQSPMVLQSPSRFAAYAAETMFATLPPLAPETPVPADANAARRR